MSSMSSSLFSPIQREHLVLIKSNRISRREDPKPKTEITNSLDIPLVFASSRRQIDSSTSFVSRRKKKMFFWWHIITWNYFDFQFGIRKMFFFLPFAPLLAFRHRILISDESFISSLFFVLSVEPFFPRKKAPNSRVLGEVFGKCVIGWAHFAEYLQWGSKCWNRLNFHRSFLFILGDLF